MNIQEITQKIKEELNIDLKILICEPDPFMREFLVEIFKNLNLNCKSLSSVSELIPSLLKEEFHLVILPIESTQKEDLKLIEEIKEVNKNIILYVMGEYHLGFDLGSLFSSGANEVILKPFSVGEFKARLFKVLNEFYLNKKVERFIVEDPLTGVYNRRYFEIQIREETYRALNLKYPLALLMIDLDNFKWFNDHFGHKAGDKILIAVGEFLKKNTRSKVDKVCRYGGDEFMVIMPYTSYKDAIKAVLRLFKNWENFPYKQVTFSVGIAQLIEREDLEKTITDLINRADSAMYKAKNIEGNAYIVDEVTLREFPNEDSPEWDLPSQSLL
ncbi:MAG: diguanylate cyclase [Caldimicrobium sp.]